MKNTFCNPNPSELLHVSCFSVENIWPTRSSLSCSWAVAFISAVKWECVKPLHWYFSGNSTSSSKLCQPSSFRWANQWIPRITEETKSIIGPFQWVKYEQDFICDCPSSNSAWSVARISPRRGPSTQHMIRTLQPQDTLGPGEQNVRTYPPANRKNPGGASINWWHVAQASQAPPTYCNSDIGLFATIFALCGLMRNCVLTTNSPGSHGAGQNHRHKRSNFDRYKLTRPSMTASHLLLQEAECKVNTPLAIRSIAYKTSKLWHSEKQSKNHSN